MGFFRDLKEDLSQAVNELLPDENLWGEKNSDSGLVNTSSTNFNKANGMELEDNNSISNASKQEQDINNIKTSTLKTERKVEKDILDELERIIATGQQAKKEEQKNLVSQNAEIQKSKPVVMLEEVELNNQQREQEKTAMPEKLKEPAAMPDVLKEREEPADRSSYAEYTQEEVPTEKVGLNEINQPNIAQKQTDAEALYDFEEKANPIEEMDSEQEVIPKYIQEIHPREEANSIEVLHLQKELVQEQVAGAYLEQAADTLEELEQKQVERLYLEKEANPTETSKIESNSILIEESTPESVTTSAVELTSVPIDESKPEQISEQTEEPVPEPITDVTGDSASEPITEQTEEAASEPVTEQTEEAASEPITEQTEETASDATEEAISDIAEEPASDAIEEPVLVSEAITDEETVSEPISVAKEAVSTGHKFDSELKSETEVIENSLVDKENMVEEMKDQLEEDEKAVTDAITETKNITLNEQKDNTNFFVQDNVDTFSNEKNNNSNKEIFYKEEDAIMLENATTEMENTETVERGTREMETRETIATETTETIQPSNETTVISQATRITGSITSDCSLEVLGTIEGNVECLGKLSVVGTVKGNCKGAEVYINTERLNGNIESESSVKIATGTVIIGDINGTSAVIEGAVKGEIDINGPVVIDSTAIIKGNINAKSIQINNGAVIDGYCSLSYVSVDIDNFFGAE